MQGSQEALITDIRGNFPAVQFFPRGRDLSNLWKGLSLVLAVIVPLLFWSIPAHSAFEFTLTPQNILELSNQDRIKLGLAPLHFDARLQKAAAAKAQDILKNDYFAHISPTGALPWDFVRNAGFNYSFAGENLAINYTSPYELVNDFLASPSHRENLLSPFFSDIGIAVISGNYNGAPATITVQIFGTPRSQ